jgi:O-acetylserine/cysteine efflux transporter
MSLLAITCKFRELTGDHDGMNTSRRHAVAALVAAGLLWGTTVPLSKLALQWLAPGWLTAVRFGLAAAVLLPIARRRAGGQRRGHRLLEAKVLASGALGYGGTVIVQNAGIIRTSVTHAALLIGAAPVLVAVVAALWHRTVARPVAWLGFAISLGGVGLVTAGGAGGGATVRGDGLVLVSLVMSATFTVAQARILAGRDPVAVTAVQFLGAALGALTFTVMAEGAPAVPGRPGPVLAAAALALVGTLGPFTLFAYGQSRVPAEVAGAFLNIEPLVGAIAGVMFFGDPAGPRQLAGALAIVLGIGFSAVSGGSAKVRAEQREVGGREPVAGGLGLMPVGVDERQGTGRLEPGSFVGGQDQRRRGQIVGQLLGGARADDQRGHPGPAEGPGQGDLGGRNPALLPDADQDLHQVIQALGVVDRRLAPVRQLPGPDRRLVVPAVLARQQPAC